MTRLFGRKTSLRHGLLTALVIGPLLLVLGFSLALDGLVTRSLQREVRLSFEELAQGLADRLDIGMFERYREIRIAANLLSGEGALGRSPEDSQRYLDALQQTFPAYAWIGVTDGQGTVLASTGGLLVGRSVAQRPWFQEGRKAPWAGDVHDALLLAKVLTIPAGTPLRLVDFAAPVTDAKGRQTGVVGAHLNWDWAASERRRLMLALADRPGAEVLVLGRDGQVLLGPEGLLRDPADALTSLGARGGEAGLREVEGRDGGRYVLTGARTRGHLGFEGLGWSVVVMQPAEEAYAAADRIRLRRLGIGLAVAALASLLGWWLAHSIAVPLSGLSATALQLCQGNREVTFAQHQRFNELRTLSVSLRLLLRKVTRREQDLRAANQDLERRVSERTYDLDLTNSALMNEIAIREDLELERDKLIESLRDQARLDPLTGLLNRRAFLPELEREIEVARRHGTALSLVMFDIDHFKRVNDEHGHAVGDKVIAAVARTGLSVCRRIDFLGRHGGEEFILLLPQTGLTDAHAMAERLRREVEAIELPGAEEKTLRVTISLGVTEMDLDDDADSLMARADEALYAAKRGGRNRVAA